MIASCPGLIFNGRFLLVLAVLLTPMRAYSAQLWAVDLGSRASIDPMPINPTTGAIYGLAANGLYRIDTTTGATTLIDSSAIRPAGLAFTNVPEPTTLALAMLLSLATLSRRR